MKNILILLLTFSWVSLFAQELVHKSFKDTRVINSHSLETLKQGKLDMRIAHRFGDLAGSQGGWPTFYGLENAADVLIGFEYGVTDRLMVGLSRAKGASELRQNVHGLIKYRAMVQDINGNNPFSLTFSGTGSATTMAASETPGRITFFEKFAHRLSYHVQTIVGRKFSPRLSGQLAFGWTFRNLVTTEDKNDLINISTAWRIQVTKSMGFIIDAVMPISDLRTTENEYYMPLGFGLEWETGGGHVFQLNFTNAKGLVETDFIPYTRSNWLDGEYRMGFTISRLFTL